MQVGTAVTISGNSGIVVRYIPWRFWIEHFCCSNLNVSGVITYEDVTNVDSIGVMALKWYKCR